MKHLTMCMTMLICLPLTIVSNNQQPTTNTDDCTITRAHTTSFNEANNQFIASQLKIQSAFAATGPTGATGLAGATGATGSGGSGSTAYLFAYNTSSTLIIASNNDFPFNTIGTSSNITITAQSNITFAQTGIYECILYTNINLIATNSITFVFKLNGFIIQGSRKSFESTTNQKILVTTPILFTVNNSGDVLTINNNGLNNIDLIRSPSTEVPLMITVKKIADL